MTLSPRHLADACTGSRKRSGRDGQCTSRVCNNRESVAIDGTPLLGAPVPFLCPFGQYRRPKCLR